MLIMIGILHWIIPGGEDVSVRYFAAHYVDEKHPVSGAPKFYLPDWDDPKMLPKKFIPVMDDHYDLQGVVVEFDAGVTRYSGTVKSDNYHDPPGYHIEFERGSGTGTFNIPQGKD